MKDSYDFPQTPSVRRVGGHLPRGRMEMIVESCHSRSYCETVLAQANIRDVTVHEIHSLLAGKGKRHTEKILNSKF
jgi:hypothetical protein